jgi:hypothetical protein
VQTNRGTTPQRRQQMDSNRTAKNALISKMLLDRVAQGVPVPQAFDEIFGAGAYKRLADEIWEAANAKVHGAKGGAA